MEIEHISREAAWNGIYNCPTKTDADGYIWVRTKDVAHMIDDIPAADVRPVVRGKWTPGERFCPICGENKFRNLDADIWADWQPNFCPNCGADMRGN